MMRRVAGIGVAVLACVAAAQAAGAGDGDRRLRTYANPLDLPYRFQPPSGLSKLRVPYREAADPTVVRFRGEYWLFASHSLGYWRSADLQHWRFVAPTGFPLAQFAPTAVELGGRLYLAVSEGARHIWVSDDPGAGRWSVAADIPAGYQDPCLFVDRDGQLYMYDGLAPSGPLHVARLDPKTFLPLAAADVAGTRDKADRGWEVPGDRNERMGGQSWVEGAWMTAHAGRYYLEYSAPGTENKTYANGLVTASAPMGPFAYAPYSPFAAKPTGFIGGAGHGSTFQGPGGKWWHIGTMTISVRHLFERRLGLFPARFLPTGELVADTYLGDYPHYYDGSRGLTGWMLLSRGKRATASSALPGMEPERAADEDVRTWWSAASGAPGEWFQLDLGRMATVQALQVNLADQDAAATGASADAYRYAIDASTEGRHWRAIAPTAACARDAPHCYLVLPRPTAARFIRLTNRHSPNGAKFSLYDLRVFGNAAVPLPGAVAAARATRDPADGRHASIAWRAVPGAGFYIVRLGIRAGLMVQNYQVTHATTLEVRSLDRGVDYVFTVDAVNERGITRGRFIGRLDAERSAGTAAR